MKYPVQFRTTLCLSLVALAMSMAVALAQLQPAIPQRGGQFGGPSGGGARRGGRGGGGFGEGGGFGGFFPGGGGIPQRDYVINGPQWELNPAFKEDAFVFARLHYAYGSGRRTWDDDTSDADVNITFRLKEVTSMLTRPGLAFVDIKPENLSQYPFVYLAAAGGVDFTADEIAALRPYLLNGGFMMAEDFWGDDQWDHFYGQFKRLFPSREPVHINLEDPIFHTVFNFKALPQMPSVSSWTRYGSAIDPGFNYNRYGSAPRYFAAYDDKHRMMMLICHNNHYGDGWEHEGDDHSYFDVFSEPQAYPMMINILYYTMTH